MDKRDTTDDQYDQQQIEEAIINVTRDLCSINNTGRELVNINTLGQQEINMIAAGTRFEFYHYAAMQWLACSMRFTFVSPASAAGLAVTAAVKNSITKLSRIGDLSSGGFVWQTSFRDVEDLVLLKTPKPVRQRDKEADINVSDIGIYHEFFIGTLFTNRLRARVLNFMFVYGLFKCTKPRLQGPDPRQVTSFCDSIKVDLEKVMTPDEIRTLREARLTVRKLQRRGLYDDANKLQERIEILEDSLYEKHYARLDIPINYLLIENIPGGRSLTAELRSLNVTLPGLIGHLVQLTIALDHALQAFDFCHYDLHTDNILMRFLPEQPGRRNFVEMIPPGGREGPLYIETSVILTIIDYGRSHVIYRDPRTGNEQHFGYFLAAGGGVVPDRSKPAYDLYKLLGFIAYETIMGYSEKADRERAATAGGVEVNSSLTSTVPMSLGSDQHRIRSTASLEAAIEAERAKRAGFTIQDIMEYNEATEIASKIPDVALRNIILLLSFFPFFRETYGLQLRENYTNGEVVRFFLREFDPGRFNIKNRWPEADGALKPEFYRSFLRYLGETFPAETNQVIFTRNHLPPNNYVYQAGR